MLTYYVAEIINKDRLREEYKEAEIRRALREAYGDQRSRFPLFPELWCQLRSFLAGIWLPKYISLKDFELHRNVDPCMVIN
jgi:hypothetical protein